MKIYHYKYGDLDCYYIFIQNKMSNMYNSGKVIYNVSQTGFTVGEKYLFDGQSSKLVKGKKLISLNKLIVFQ